MLRSSPGTEPTRVRNQISEATKRAIRERDENRCVICKHADSPLEIDHILPIRAGGTNDPENLRLVCRAFNRGGRCHALRIQPPSKKRKRRPQAPAPPGTGTDTPTLTVEIQFSRQFYFHELALPGEPKPTYHRWMWQAIEAAELAGCETLTVVIDDREYLLQLTEGDP